MAEAKEELSLVCPSDIVFYHTGDEVVLSCHLKPAVSAISMEIQWWHKANLVCHYKNRQVAMNTHYKGRASLSLDDLQKGNLSLTLRDIKASQTGLYICQVTHESQTIQENVFLYIRSEDFSLVTAAGVVSADPGEDVILPAHLSPETNAVSMEIRWFRGTELIYQYKNEWEKKNSDYADRVHLSLQELKRGNLSLTLRKFQPSDSGDFICKVFHDGCLQTGTLHLQVKGKSNDDARVTHLRNVLSQVQKDILEQKMGLLVDTLTKIQVTLNPDEMRKPFGPRRTPSMEGIRPHLGDEDIFGTHKMGNKGDSQNVLLGESQNVIQITGKIVRPYYRGSVDIKDDVKSLKES